MARPAAIAAGTSVTDSGAEPGRTPVRSRIPNTITAMT